MPPALIILVSIVWIVFAIARLKLPAFFALISAALIVGLGTAWVTGDAPITAIDRTMREFGNSAGKLAYSIGIAAFLGEALLLSGAARSIVRGLIATCGEARAPLALAFTGFLLSIAVFFDTVFFLLIPIAAALARQTGKNYLGYMLAICAGAVVSHATIPPTPGPLATLQALDLPFHVAIFGGVLAGLIPAGAGLLFARWANAKYDLSPPAAPKARNEDESKDPRFWAALSPILVPLLLIGAHSLFHHRLAGTATGALIGFVGDKNIALSIGAIIAVGLCTRGIRRWSEALAVVEPALQSAGAIILITAAGGAYGGMIGASGIGDSISSLSSTLALPIVPLAWGICQLLRAAQGSSTVAMITTVGIVAPLLPDLTTAPLLRLPVFLAIAYGALGCSWLNDSGFWVFSRMGHVSDRIALRTWSPLLQLISIVGLIEAWVLYALLA